MHSKTGESRWDLTTLNPLKDEMSTVVSEPTVDIYLWYEYMDEASQSKYWVHATTHKTQWNPPKWMDHFDTSTHQMLYHNTLSGETQYYRPFDFEPIQRDTPVGPVQAVRKLSGTH